MEQKTKAEYIRQAENYLKGVEKRKGKITRLAIQQCLLEDAPKWRPAYFTKLRRAIVVQQTAAGYKKYAKQIEQIKNPCTNELLPDSEKKPIKKKKMQMKHIRENDEKALIEYFKKNQNIECRAAMYIVKNLGVRPAEIKSLEVSGDSIHVIGAKKNKDRGLDRIIKINDSYTLKHLATAISILKKTSRTIGQIQDNISKASRRVFKNRDRHYSLYSWRHQMGAELKASSMPDHVISYLMGHQSTRSIEAYGFKNRAKGGLKIQAGGYDKRVRYGAKSQYLRRVTTYKSQNVNNDRDLCR